MFPYLSRFTWSAPAWCSLHWKKTIGDKTHINDKRKYVTSNRNHFVVNFFKSHHCLHIGPVYCPVPAYFSCFAQLTSAMALLSMLGHHYRWHCCLFLQWFGCSSSSAVQFRSLYSIKTFISPLIRSCIRPFPFPSANFFSNWVICSHLLYGILAPRARLRMPCFRE